MSEHVTDLTGSWTSALAADALMDALNDAHDHGRSTVFTSDGSVIAAMIPRELMPPAVPDMTNAPDWNGWRLTLNCAHLLLTDQDDYQIGRLAFCDMCPLTTHGEGSPGLPSRQMRVIVDRQPVHAPAAPELLSPSYWYGT
jgi:hypothetical protein